MSHRVRREAQGAKEFLAEDLAGMNRGKFLCHSGMPFNGSLRSRPPPAPHRSTGTRSATDRLFGSNAFLPSPLARLPGDFPAALQDRRALSRCSIAPVFGVQPWQCLSETPLIFLQRREMALRRQTPSRGFRTGRRYCRCRRISRASCPLTPASPPLCGCVRAHGCEAFP